MTIQEFKDIFYNGVWKQNTGLSKDTPMISGAQPRSARIRYR